MYAISVVCVVLGIFVAVTATRASGGDDATARAFRSDPSCGADLAVARTGGTAAGACHVADATIVQATELVLGSVRHRHLDDAVVLRVGGERRRVHLSSENGATFVHTVATDAPARVQFYRDAVVRVEASGVTAETLAAPDVVAGSNAQMPWVGAGIAAIGVVFGVAATALRRRARASFGPNVR